MSTRERLLKEVVTIQFEQIRERNPKYSLRAFARSLRVSPSTMSRLLSGKGELTGAILDRIARNLKLEDSEKVRLIKAEFDPWIKNEANADLLAFIRCWYDSPIVCLTQTETFEDDPAWIAKALNIKVNQVRASLGRLERLGFLLRNKKGKLEAADVALSTRGIDAFGGGPDGNLLAKLELARHYLLKNHPTTGERSDFSSVVMAVEAEKLPEAKRRILRFRRSLSKFLDTGNKTDVYLLSVQLFPVTQASEEIAQHRKRR